MKKIKPKHIILFLLGLLTISRYIHFGDYCEGMSTGLKWLFFCLLFVTFFIIILIINIYKKYSDNEKIDNLIFLIFILFLVLNIFYLFDNKTERKDITLIANENNSIPRNSLTLYRDSTFQIEENQLENWCFTVGKYKIKDESLILSRKDIEEKTDYNFTNYYLIKDSLLIPISKNKIDTLKID